MPHLVSAQYNPQQKNGLNFEIFDIVSHIIGFIMDAIQFFIGIWVMYLLLFVIIAAILYFTSGGDEDRMDKAMEWWKRSAIGLIIAPIAFVIISLVSDALDI